MDDLDLKEPPKSDGMSVFTVLDEAIDLVEDLDGRLKKAKRQRAEAEECVKEALAELGIASVNTGRRSFTAVRKVYAKWKLDAQAAGQPLKDAGLGHLVHATANLNSVSAHYRELVGDDDLESFDLPEELEDVLELRETYGISARRV